MVLNRSEYTIKILHNIFTQCSNYTSFDEDEIRILKMIVKAGLPDEK